jgi:ribosomal protein L16 Arg81 hydroxylase
MRDKGQGQVEQKTYSLDLVKDGAAGTNVILQSGDVVYVPKTKPHKSILDKVIETVRTIGIFGFLL